MSQEILSKITIDKHSTIREALTAIDDSAIGVCLVEDDESTLIDVLTDGDIRRMLLSGLSLESRILANKDFDFISVPPSMSRSDVLDIMQARKIEHVPVTNQQGKIQGIHTLSELVSKEPLLNAAVIMAGGKGTRLGELTKNTPKPMLKVAGRPILERIILHLVGSGIQEIYISVNYLAEMIENHFGNGEAHGCKIHYLKEEEPLGTGGALKLLPQSLQQPILVMNGDLICDVNVRHLLDFHHRGEFQATMALNAYTHEVPYGCVDYHEGRILKIDEKPLIRKTINTGIYIINPQLIKDVDYGFYPITKLFDSCLANNKPVGGYLMNNEWQDIGLPNELNKAQGNI